MTISVVFPSCSPIGCTIISMAKACSAHLLIIIDSVLLEYIIESGDSISIACIESISSELLQFAIRHLLSFLKLLRI